MFGRPTRRARQGVPCCYRACFESTMSSAFGALGASHVGSRCARVHVDSIRSGAWTREDLYTTLITKVSVAEDADARNSRLDSRLCAKSPPSSFSSYGGAQPRLHVYTPVFTLETPLSRVRVIVAKHLHPTVWPSKGLAEHDSTCIDRMSIVQRLGS